MSTKTEALNMWPIPENSLQKDPVIDQNAEATAQAMVGIVTRNLIADANYTLLPADYLCNVLTFTDTGAVLTAGRDMIYPALFPRQTVVNLTAQTLTLKMAGQTGITIAAGKTTTIVSGPDDVLDVAAAVSGAVTSVNGATGVVVLGGESIAEPVTVLTPSSGVVNIDCALGDYFTLAPTANVTSIVFTNLPASGKAQTIMVRFTQDSSARTVAWPASFKWAGGTAGVVSTGSGAIDVLAITTFNQGTSWIATLAKAFA